MMKRIGESILILFSFISAWLAVIAAVPALYFSGIFYGVDSTLLGTFYQTSLTLTPIAALVGNAYFLIAVRAPDRFLGDLPLWGKILVTLGWVASGFLWYGVYWYVYWNHVY